jgi:toxin secretion/phage lysis holin
MTTLVMFMAIDYVSGIVVACVFHKSNKSASGAFESRAGWKGLVKKCFTLLFVLIAHRIDLIFADAVGIELAMHYVRDTVIIGFIVNELFSIVENAGLMGLPLPKIILRALEVLQSRVDDRDIPTENKDENERAE